MHLFILSALSTLIIPRPWFVIVKHNQLKTPSVYISWIVIKFVFYSCYTCLMVCKQVSNGESSSNTPHPRPPWTRHRPLRNPSQGQQGPHGPRRIHPPPY